MQMRSLKQQHAFAHMLNGFYGEQLVTGQLWKITVKQEEWYL